MHTHRLISLAVDQSATGPGTVMRAVIVIAVVGVALMAWLLLRGYRDND